MFAVSQRMMPGIIAKSEEYEKERDSQFVVDVLHWDLPGAVCEELEQLCGGQD